MVAGRCKKSIFHLNREMKTHEQKTRNTVDRNSNASSKKPNDSSIAFPGMPAVYAACGTLAAVILFFCI